MDNISDFTNWVFNTRDVDMIIIGALVMTGANSMVDSFHHGIVEPVIMSLILENYKDQNQYQVVNILGRNFHFQIHVAIAGVVKLLTFLLFAYGLSKMATFITIGPISKKKK